MLIKLKLLISYRIEYRIRSKIIKKYLCFIIHLQINMYDLVFILNVGSERKTPKCMQFTRNKAFFKLVLISIINSSYKAYELATHTFLILFYAFRQILLFRTSTHKLLQIQKILTTRIC